MPKHLDPGVAGVVPVERDRRTPPASLARRARDTMAELRASRQRLIADADVTREQIERDIHDGVQQRLTGLRIRLTMAATRFHELGDEDASAAFADFGAQLETAIDELRAVARGVYPPLLASDGLRRALEAAARHAGQRVLVTSEGLGRYSREVEGAVYFSCLAAMENAARYAPQTPVTVSVWEADGELGFTVADAGGGFDVGSPSAGSGLTNMRDRIAAVGGSLTIDTSSRGTRVTAIIPLQRDSRPPAELAASRVRAVSPSRS